MKIIFLISCVLISAFVAYTSPITDNSVKKAWDIYKDANSLQFEGLTEEEHFEAFIDNYQKVVNHNKEYDAKNVTYTVKINEFSHINDQTELNTRFGLKSINRPNDTEDFNFDNVARAIIPESVDWRAYSTAIKDQRSCGGCWAFAAVGVVESLYAIKQNVYKRLSEQQLIDCTLNNPAYLSYGCNGGWPDKGFEYIRRNGVVEESYYPYRQRASQCTAGYGQRLRISSHYGVPYGDENALKKAVALYGPVAVGIDASKWGFMHYSSGIYTDYGCSRTNVNHAVIVVGYGRENGRDFWLIKNSWGSRWGMNGYMKMARNMNMCGITRMASFAML